MMIHSVRRQDARLSPTPGPAADAMTKLHLDRLPHPRFLGKEPPMGLGASASDHRMSASDVT
eukprot:217112-Hanusia_phi.AAC.1